jgi:hypothetical protein
VLFSAWQIAGLVSDTLHLPTAPRFQWLSGDRTGTKFFSDAESLLAVCAAVD